MIKYKLICLAFILVFLTGCQTVKVDQKEAAPQENSIKENEPQTKDAPSSSDNDDKNQSKTGNLSNAVIIGDSIALKFKLFATDKQKGDPNYLDLVKFLVAGSLGWANSLWPVSDKSVHPTYNGQKMLIEDAISQMGAKKAIFMLGMNDIGLYGIDKTIENAEKLLANVKQKSPDIKIYLQSVTPMVETRQLKDLNNTNITKFNARLAQLCQENSWVYCDIAPIFTNANGALSPEYCSDPNGLGIHLTDAGCENWAKYWLERSSET
ncbi:MAG: GDSL-type esterase/lipase family protein [Oscillospiraceae bacterium]|jgi:hypothetical protein|nr:GDSL-type esterase/lipase family protein [Oscillospiraceae bacterium]